MTLVGYPVSVGTVEGGSPGVNMAQLFSQTAGLFQQSSKLQGGQVVYQVLENVIRCVTEPP